MNKIATAKALVKLAKALLANPMDSGFIKHSNEYVKELGKLLGIHSTIEFKVEHYKDSTEGYGGREGVLDIHLIPKQLQVSDIEQAKNQIFKAVKAVYTHRQYSIDTFKLLSIDPTANGTNIKIHFNQSDF
jgi:hypothetical protein